MGRWKVCVVVMALAVEGLGCNEVLEWDLPAAGEPPSCADLPATCGSEKNDNCCNTSMILGRAASTGASSGTPGIRLDRYEVTVGRFNAYLDTLDESASEKLKGLVSSCAPATYSEAGEQHLPINCVTWQEADAFCRADEGFLPSKEQLESAAFGILDAGNIRDRAVIQPYSAPEVVGSKGLWQEQSADLIGNVEEWTTNPQAPQAMNQSVWGGAFGVPETDFTNAGIPLNPKQVESRESTVGFRCARNP